MSIFCVTKSNVKTAEHQVCYFKVRISQRWKAEYHKGIVPGRAGAGGGGGAGERSRESIFSSNFMGCRKEQT